MKALILSITILFTSLAQAQAVAKSTPEQGLWERFCLNDKIADACGRAINSLVDKMEEAPVNELMALQGRIDKVAETGCQLQNKTACSRMMDDAEVTMPIETIGSLEN